MLATYQGASQRRGLSRLLHLAAQPDRGRFSINFDDTLRLLNSQTFIWQPKLPEGDSIHIDDILRLLIFFQIVRASIWS